VDSEVRRGVFYVKMMSAGQDVLSEIFLFHEFFHTHTHILYPYYFGSKPVDGNLLPDILAS
jgi:hypothetical protein